MTKVTKIWKKCKITFWVEISKLVGEGIPHLLPELLTLSSKPPIFHLQFRHLEILGCTWRCWPACVVGEEPTCVIFFQNDNDLAVKLADPLHFPQTTLCGCDSVSFSLLLKLELLNLVTSGEMIQSKSLLCSLSVLGTIVYQRGKILSKSARNAKWLSSNNA